MAISTMRGVVHFIFAPPYGIGRQMRHAEVRDEVTLRVRRTGVNASRRRGAVSNAPVRVSDIDHGAGRRGTTEGSFVRPVLTRH
jgi:hypothetical protein